MDSLYYTHITGASYESQSYAWAMVIGIPLIIFGGWLSTYSFIPGLLLIGIGLIIAGVSCMIGGIYSYFSPTAWYQLKAVGISKTELKRWRTTNVEADAKALARFIQDQIDRREIPPPTAKEKEVVTKEIVLIKCEYCGSLMPQTATFCPNCGAKRR